MIVSSSILSGSAANAGPRYQFETHNDELEKKLNERLRALDWVETGNLPDVIVSATTKATRTEVCWSVSLGWWDGKVSNYEKRCAPMHVGFIETAPATPAELDRLVLGPALRDLTQAAAVRRPVRLTNPGTNGVAVQVGGVRAPLLFGPAGAVVWLDTQGATPSVTSGKCLLALNPATSSVDLNELTTNQKLRLSFVQDGKPVDAVRVQKDTAFELAITDSPAGPEVELPCSGEPSASLLEKAGEYLADQKPRAILTPTQRFAWTVRTKADEGRFNVQLRSANATTQGVVLLQLAFAVPWWQTIYSKLTAVLLGVGALVAALSAVIEPIRKLLKKPS
jgi:hypothetical protein